MPINEQQILLVMAHSVSVTELEIYVNGLRAVMIGKNTGSILIGRCPWQHIYCQLLDAGGVRASDSWILKHGMPPTSSSAAVEEETTTSMVELGTCLGCPLMRIT